MPEHLTLALSRAKEFLITEPGPNLLRRRHFAPIWLDFWGKLSQQFCNQRTESRPGFTRSGNLWPFGKIRDCVEGEVSGALFVAGAEGHYGHVYAAQFMGMWVTPVWAFEQDSYFATKERRNPFLPLELRLSMWEHFGIDYLTVSPERDSDVDLNTHYARLFQKLGVTYCFATEGDPDLVEKIDRGAISPFRIIPRVSVPSTTVQVEHLLPPQISSPLGFQDILSDDDLFGI